MEAVDFSRLRHIDAEWDDIEASYRLAPYETPTNLLTERQKVIEAFSRGYTYDPQFDYLPSPDFPEPRIRQFMAALQPDRSIFEREYYNKARNELLSIECVQQHEPQLITGLSCIVYGQPEKKLVEHAQHILSEPVQVDDAEQPGTVSAVEAVTAIEAVLRAVGLVQWRVVVYEPMLAKMAVHRLDKEIRIRAGSVFSPDGIRRLIVHEIGVHVLRYENGSRQPIKIFANGFTDYLETEEGLAVYEEQTAGLLEPSTLRKYAGRVIAAHLAVNHSFGDVFSRLVAHFDCETTFDIVARAKRCFKDTSRHGAHTKDMVYLSGLQKVSSHLQYYPGDRDLLFVGKFGLKQLALVRSLLDANVLNGSLFQLGNLAAYKEVTESW